MIVLVDTDILIEVLRGRDTAIVAQWEKLATSRDTLLCSVVSVAEIGHGVRPKEETAVNRLFAALPCIPIDAAVAHQAGVFLRRFHKSHSLELGDAFIAATAQLHSARLWTRNRKHYPMPQLQFH